MTARRVLLLVLGVSFIAASVAQTPLPTAAEIGCDNCRAGRCRSIGRGRFVRCSECEPGFELTRLDDRISQVCLAEREEKEGTCPALVTQSAGVGCDIDCRSDGDCPDAQKCCPTTCGALCMVTVEECDCGDDDEDLVCGSNGLAYRNECEAECQGVEVACEGACPCAEEEEEEEDDDDDDEEEPEEEVPVEDPAAARAAEAPEPEAAAPITEEPEMEEAEITVINDIHPEEEPLDITPEEEPPAPAPEEEEDFSIIEVPIEEDEEAVIVEPPIEEEDEEIVEPPIEEEDEVPVDEEMVEEVTIEPPVEEPDVELDEDFIDEDFVDELVPMEEEEGTTDGASVPAPEVEETIPPPEPETGADDSTPVPSPKPESSPSDSPMDESDEDVVEELTSDLDEK